MVSQFQKQLDSLSLSKADYCHEVKEVIDAIEYLEDDIAQAGLAKDAAIQAGEELRMPSPDLLSQIVADLRSAKRNAKDLLERSGCPAYKEAY